MTTETTVLVRHSVYLEPKRSGEDSRVAARLALSQLFTVFARDLLEDREIDLMFPHEIELSSVTEHWDQKFVLKLIKIEL